MEPARDESQPPNIRVEPAQPARGDLLATTTFWLAFIAVSSLLFGRVSWPGGSHFSDEKRIADAVMNVGSLFALVAMICAICLVYRFERATRLSKLAMFFSVAAFVLLLLRPGI